MKRFLSLIPMAFLLMAVLHAQPSVTWGTKVKQGGSLIPKSLSRLPLSNSFAFKTKSLYRPFIQRIGEDLTAGEDEELKNPQSRLELERQYQFQFGSESYLVSEYSESKTSTYQVHLEKIDPYAPRLSTSKVIEGLIPGPGLHFIAESRPVFSPDGKLMLLVTKSKKVVGSFSTFKINVLDQSLDLVWEKEIDLARTDHIFTLEDFVLDNDGNVFLGGRLSSKQSVDAVNGPSPAAFLVLAYLGQGSTDIEHQVEVAGQYVTGIKMSISEKGNLAFAGFYSENENLETKGCFYLMVDKADGKVISESTLEFDAEFLNQYLSQREERFAASRSEKGKSNLLFEYNLRNLVQRADGGAFIIAEQTDLSAHIVGRPDPTTGLYDRNNREYSFTRYRFDILVAGIDPMGKVEWVRKIPKRQVEIVAGPSLSSYAFMKTDKKLYLLFNDDPANMNKGPKDKLKYFRMDNGKLVVAVTSLDFQGNVEREYLKNGEPLAISLCPTLCQQVSPTEMLLYAEGRGGIQYGKMIFTD